MCKMRNSIYVLLGLILFSCSTSRLAINKNSKVTEIGISLNYDAVLPSVKSNIEENVDVFISEYNSSSKRLKLHRSINSDSSSLIVNVLGTRLVTPQQQTTGAIVSLIGLSLPFVMVAAGSEFYIFFYYFPRVVSVTDFSLSSDINGSEVSPIQYKIVSPGFLKSEEKQVKKHGPRFKKHLFRVMKDLEASRK